jgi:outer membrane immunogenic protein
MPRVKGEDPHMKRTIAGFAVALALSASAAVADGMDRRAVVACCASTWTGFYIGAGAGGGAIVYDVDGFGDFGGEGFFGTVTLGYDRQIGARTVAGIFADYDFSNTSTARLGVTGEVQSIWSVGARLGLLTSPTTLWYATAGYTQMDLDLDIAISVPTFGGYFLGGGVESQLGGGWSLRGEYRFSEFDSEEIGGVDVDPSMHSVRAVLSYKFGRREESSYPLK